MKTRFTIALMLATFVTLGAAIAEGKTPSMHSKKSAPKASKVVPYSRCVWGPANGAAPSGWVVLVCGSGKQAERPYAIAPATSSTWDDTEVMRPVIRIIDVHSGTIDVGVNISGGKEFVYDIPRAKLPKASKGEWYTADPAVVKQFKALAKADKLATID